MHIFRVQSCPLACAAKQAGHPHPEGLGFLERCYKYGLVYKSDIYDDFGRDFYSSDAPQPKDDIIEQTRKYLEIIHQQGHPVVFLSPKTCSNIRHPKLQKRKCNGVWKTLEEEKN